MLNKLNNKGFTLLELIISLSILMFVIVSFLNIFVNGAAYISFSGQKSSTSSITQSMANESIDQKAAIGGASSVTTDMVIELTPSKAITIKDINIVTVIDSKGNQNSEIILVIP